MNDKDRARIYLYRSPIGLVSIRQNIGAQGNWLLCFETFRHSTTGELLSSTQPVSLWPTAEDAARAVFQRDTRFQLWDQLPLVVFPASLEDWQEASALESVPKRD
ncbi:hypothetical protein [Burkholderia territorii]|uniref:hypothetical protein n=1 Tax=Burkholderia territorii TaxID=1503055 RepID=UPI000751D431|nr:hypothetical protein [Burkholderia territorii]KWO62586.1 hypothetical protein WT98_30435 [Burkholderia territorii]